MGIYLSNDSKISQIRDSVATQMKIEKSQVKIGAWTNLKFDCWLSDKKNIYDAQTQAEIFAI